MKRWFQFKSIRARLIYWFFVITIVPLTVASVMIYSQMMNSRKTAIFTKLEAIRDLKVKEVNNWLDERIGDIRTIAADDEIRILEKVHENKEEDMRKNIAIIADARVHLDRFVQYFHALHKIFILNPNTGKIMVSTDEKEEGENHSNTSYFKETLQKRELFIKDIYYSTPENKPVMTISIPVFGLSDSEDIIGILVAGINLDASLYDLLLNRTGMEKTGETLIINRDLVVLNELRWHKDAPLNLRIKVKSALEAVRGKTGIAETEDYRGEMVLAAYTYIPRTEWGFVAKQDIKEVYAPIYQLRKWTFSIGILTCFVMIIAAFRVSKSISEPIKLLQQGSETIGNGNLDYKVGTDTKDEIGQLSRSFDEMTHNLKNSRVTLENEITERKRLEKEILKIEEMERQRIGHDLHDNLGQQLTGISYISQLIESRLKEKSIPEAKEAARLTFLINKTSNQIKLMSRGLSLMMENGKEGLMVAIEDLASNTEKAFNIPCVLKCNKPVPVYNETAVTHLYRIVQEAVTNAVKHAKPGHIEICLNKVDDKIKLTIKDNGTGIAAPNQGKGIGLQIMKYRADIIGASLDIQSDINKGTLVSCILFDERRNEIKGPEKDERLGSYLSNI